MYLFPLIRSSRAITACYIIPEEPIKAIAISEFVSVIIPLLNPKLFSRIYGLMLTSIYNPSFASFYLESYNKINNIHNQAEICCLLLFLLYNTLIYI